ncbi:MAG: ornithine cyclodeaminase family protein [Haloarculaceae archaeon]
MVRILPDEAVASLLDLEDLLPVIEDAFRKQGRCQVELPERPHMPVGIDLDGEPAGGRTEESLGVSLTMPAYVHGEETLATKLVTIHDDNPARGLPTVNAQVVVTDAATGQPLAFAHGNRITNARTGCIGGLAVRHLATGPVDLGVLGAGTQARWQTRTVDAATDLRSVRIYAPSDSREACAADLRAELDADVRAVASSTAAVTDANVVMTTTTSATPVFDGDDLAPGTLVVGIGAYTPELQEIDETTFERAARVFADVPEEAATVGDVAATDLDADDLVPLSAVFEGEAGRESDDEILVVESVGNAVLDAATAAQVYGEAERRDAGTVVEF